MINNLIENHHLVQALWSAVNTSAGSLENVAPLVRRLLETEAWKKREVPQLGKEPIEFTNFSDFIVTPPLKGCGWPINKVEALIKDDPQTVALWRDAIKRPVGTNQHTIEDGDNVTIHDGRGNSLSYTVSRLKRERPDLFEKVIAKKLSANAAAIEAGFRKKPIKHCPKCGHEW